VIESYDQKDCRINLRYLTVRIDGLVDNVIVPEQFWKSLKCNLGGEIAGESRQVSTLSSCCIASHLESFFCFKKKPVLLFSACSKLFKAFVCFYFVSQVVRLISDINTGRTSVPICSDRDEGLPTIRGELSSDSEDHSSR
jgi:hypothetical protein